MWTLVPSYMEVAVNFSPIASFGKSAAAAVLVAGLSAGIVGCAGDYLSYASESRAAGIAQLNENQPDKAAGSFQNAVRQNPRDYQSFYWLGVSYDRQGAYAQAAQAYRTSLDVQQGTYDGRKDVVFRRKTLDGLAIAIAKSPTRNEEIAMIEQKNAGREKAEDALLLARIYFYSGDADSAIECYNRAALLDPEDALISKEVGLYFEKIGQTKNAEPLLKRAYTANPQDAEVTAALRRLGIVPGPSLKEERALAKPPMPLGPIPELNNDDQAPRSTASGVQAPRE
jgi:tetratricopeptide (TPR) repeat protein